MVNRDGGNVFERSDWFDICGLANLDLSGIMFVGLFIDESGSMTRQTVLASIHEFERDVTNANLTISSVRAN